MLDNTEFDNTMIEPNWREDEITVEFIFRHGLRRAVTIDLSEMSLQEVWDVQRQLLGKRKLLQSIFEHGTHGQITIIGLTVRADDLIAMVIY